MISVWHQSTARAIRKHKDPFALVWLSRYCDVILWSFCAAPLQVEHTYWQMWIRLIGFSFSLNLAHMYGKLHLNTEIHYHFTYWILHFKWILLLICFHINTALKRYNQRLNFAQIHTGSDGIVTFSQFLYQLVPTSVRLTTRMTKYFAQIFLQFEQSGKLLVGSSHGVHENMTTNIL